MKTGRLFLILFFGVILLGSLSMAAEEHEGEQEPYMGSAGFERIKLLVGSWEGEMDMGKGPVKVNVTYKLTSGGSAIVETFFEGAPHEMVSIYHDTPKRELTMTHYCSLGNQPKMMLMSLEGDVLEFDLAKDAAIDVAKDHHMHSLRITMKGQDQMTQKWMQYKKGKAGEIVEVPLKRVM